MRTDMQSRHREDVAVPFLRSPPFPWVDAAVGSVNGHPAARQPSREEARAAIAPLRLARVGGAFWEPPAPDGDCWSYLENKARIELQGPICEAALIAWLSGVEVWREGEILPDADLEGALLDTLTEGTFREPFFGEPATLGATIALLGQWRSQLDGNRNITMMVGMARWKRSAMQRFLWSATGTPSECPAERALARAGQGADIAFWPSRTPPTFRAAARAAGSKAICVEDGFVRSNGLGADLRAPASITLDWSGAYFDPSGSSDLETLLAEYDFSPALQARARRLRRRICELGVTKYGIERGDPPVVPTGRRVVLALGQVEDDLSVELAGGGIRSNLDFLLRVREHEPDAHIIYRPHPDVRAGHRTGHVGLTQALAHADSVATDGPLLPLVERADAVHVLSSLTGFEALLRGCHVVTYGTPFYAGWGLTEDRAPVPARRGRRLTIDQLVAATLILYPRYMDPVTGLPCPPEVLIERMGRGEAAADSWLTKLRRAQGWMRRRAALAADVLS